MNPRAVLLLVLGALALVALLVWALMIWLRGQAGVRRDEYKRRGERLRDAVETLREIENEANAYGEVDGLAIAVRRHIREFNDREWEKKA